MQDGNMELGSAECDQTFTKEGGTTQNRNEWKVSGQWVIAESGIEYGKGQS